MEKSTFYLLIILFAASIPFYFGFWVLLKKLKPIWKEQSQFDRKARAISIPAYIIISIIIIYGFIPKLFNFPPLIMYFFQ